MRLLVVEDEADLAEAVARGLRRDGYAVDVAADGEDALEKLAVNEYDLVCLDLTLPGVGGREVCRRIRADARVDPAPRVLMLTARDSLEDRVAGLDDGADDYLVKPFAFPELLARVRSLLRRDAGTTTALLEVAGLDLDTARHIARRGDRQLDLTAKEFALLHYFMTNAGQVLSQETLLEHVWDEHADPFTNTVRVTVGTLRRKLAVDDEPQLIETVVGRGYRLRDGDGDAGEAHAAEGRGTVSIRLRLALIYSVVLCLVAALAIGAIYLALAHALENEPPAVQVIQPGPGSQVVIHQLETAQRAANESALNRLRTYSAAALLILFSVSFGVGWLVAGYLLRPVRRITAVAREISATDLSRRISLGGPEDELRRLADTFDDMLARLDEAFANQRRFIQEASHELRNPLAVIRTNLEVTLADPNASEEDLRHTAEVVERSTDRMRRLVDDLLLYARNETPTLEREPVDAASLVREAADEFRTPAEARGLHLVSSASPGLMTIGDRNALRQALANLLANATRLAPSGSTIGVRAGREGPWVWVAVDDQGPGIAPEDHDAVFQRFWRGRTAPASGTDRRSGLGLAIVRQILEAHGGEVKLVSTPGVGSTFALWLPAAPATPETDAASHPSAAEQTGAARQM